MSKKRVLCTLAGQEMVDSSDTDDEEDQLSDTDPALRRSSKKHDRESESEEEDEEDDYRRTKGESSVSQDPNAATNLKKVHRIKIAKKPQTKIVLKGEKKRSEKEAAKDGDGGRNSQNCILSSSEMKEFDLVPKRNLPFPSCIYRKGRA